MLNADNEGIGESRVLARRKKRKKPRRTVGVGISRPRCGDLTWDLHVEAEEREQVYYTDPAQEQVTGVA